MIMYSRQLQVEASRLDDWMVIFNIQLQKLGSKDEILHLRSANSSERSLWFYFYHDSFLLFPTKPPSHGSIVWGCTCNWTVPIAHCMCYYLYLQCSLYLMAQIQRCVHCLQIVIFYICRSAGGANQNYNRSIVSCCDFMIQQRFCTGKYFSSL